jgi:hypothetical protein
MKEGFDLADMPKTFKDAIELTRALDFKFLWIDSLCIIQDDSKDWEIESSKMCDVYANAILTIGNAWATGHKEGFLGLRPRSAKKLSHTFPGSQHASKLEVRFEPRHNRSHPLFRRAWVLQERLLSKRLIFFEQDELVWECRNRRTCECRGLDSYMNKSWGEERPLTLANRYLKSSHSDLYGWWRYFVLEEYARLSLTFGKDRLPALSGLATRVIMETGDTYIAGLWKKDLALGLLWHSKHASSNPSSRTFDWEIDYEKLSTCSAEYRAPTWSWASIDGMISHSVRQDPKELPQLQQHMTVLEAECAAGGLDPTGAVKSGHLRIKCPTLIATINLRHDAKGDALYRLSFSDTSVPLRSDQYESPWCFRPDTPLSIVEYDNKEGKTGMWARRAEAEHTGIEMVDDVKVKIVFITTHVEKKTYSRYSLVLGPSSMVQGAWERVAFWGYYNDDGKRDYLEGATCEELLII